MIPLWMPSAVKPSQNFRQKRQELRSGQSWREIQSWEETMGEVLRCKLVLSKGKQGQWPKCSENLAPSRRSALPGPWQCGNRGSGHSMAWSSLLSWPPSALDQGWCSSRENEYTKFTPIYYHSLFSGNARIPTLMQLKASEPCSVFKLWEAEQSNSAQKCP